MPQTKANAKTDMQNTQLNPMGAQAVAGGQTVTLNLTFETGRSPNLAGLIDAIETLYGANKVTNDADVAARGIFRLRIAA